MPNLSLPAKTKKIKESFTKIVFPELRALGFSGGWNGFRRLTPLGVDVLVLRFDYGCLQLDAGRLPRRKTLSSRTVTQDWGDYAQAPRPKPGCARKNLYNTPQNYCFEYGDIKNPGGFDNMAHSAVRSVKREGLKFWATPLRVK